MNFWQPCFWIGPKLQLLGKRGKTLETDVFMNFWQPCFWIGPDYSTNLMPIR